MPAPRAWIAEQVGDDGRGPIALGVFEVNVDDDALPEGSLAGPSDLTIDEALAGLVAPGEPGWDVEAQAYATGSGAVRRNAAIQAPRRGGWR